MTDRGQPIDIDTVRHIVERRWSSGDVQHWAYRRLEVGRIVDVRWYVRLVDGVTHTRAYETQAEAEQVARQIMASPNRMDEHPAWAEQRGALEPERWCLVDQR